MGLEETWCCSSISARSRERLDVLYPNVSYFIKKQTPPLAHLKAQDFERRFWDREIFPNSDLCFLLFLFFLGILALSAGRGKLHICDGTTLGPSSTGWLSNGLEMSGSSKYEKSWAEPIYDSVPRGWSNCDENVWKVIDWLIYWIDDGLISDGPPSTKVVYI